MMSFYSILFSGVVLAQAGQTTGINNINYTILFGLISICIAIVIGTVKVKLMTSTGKPGKNNEYCEQRDRKSVV